MRVFAGHVADFLVLERHEHGCDAAASLLRAFGAAELGGARWGWRMVDRSELRRSGQSLTAIAIGKNGLTEGMLAELRRQIRKSKLLKIRLPEGGPTADSVAEALGASLVEQRGRTALLWRPSRPD